MKTIKAPTATKLPSGNWRCRVRIKELGIDESIVRQSRAEAEAIALGIKKGYLDAATKKRMEPLTVSQAIDRYIEKRKEALSPSTIRSYRCSQRNQFKNLMGTDVNALTDELCRAAICAESRLPISSKTLRNAWTLIASAVKDQTGKSFEVYLPKVVSQERPWLTPEQILVFLDAVKDTAVEIPALLGLHGLRRSEIMGLKWENIDLKNGNIYVRGASVLDEHGQLVNKLDNKNKSSRRTVPFMIPRLQALLEAGREDATGEFVCTFHANNIERAVDAVCKKAGLPQVGAHGLRHSFCSLAYSKGIPEKVVMKLGGWSDFQTMRKIYTHVSDSDMSQDAATMRAFYEQDTAKGCDSVEIIRCRNCRRNPDRYKRGGDGGCPMWNDADEKWPADPNGFCSSARLLDD